MPVFGSLAQILRARSGKVRSGAQCLRYGSLLAVLSERRSRHQFSQIDKDRRQSLGLGEIRHVAGLDVAYRFDPGTLDHFRLQGRRHDGVVLRTHIGDVIGV